MTPRTCSRCPAALTRRNGGGLCLACLRAAHRLPPRLCSRCDVRVRRDSLTGLCPACRPVREARQVACAKRFAGDAARLARMQLYALRASAGLPLFNDGP